MENSCPVLCGGIFLTLLIEAEKHRPEYRIYDKNAMNRHSTCSMFLDLIRIINPSYKAPADNVFSKITSEYKSCKYQSPAHLSVLKRYGSQTKSQYRTSLVNMESFIEKYFDVGPNGEIDDKLVRELLDLIAQDKGIENGEEFCVSSDSTPIRKRDLHDSLNDPLDVCLPIFLLSIWHFIIKKRPDTVIGQATYESWHKPQPKGKKEKRVYIGTIGDNYKRHLNIMTKLPDVEPPTSLQAKVRVSDSHANIGFVMEKDSVVEYENSGVIAELMQAAKDSVRNEVNTRILPDLRNKLREPTNHIYELIKSQAAENGEVDARIEFENYVHFIKSEVLIESVSKKICLSERSIYDNLHELCRLVEDHSISTSSVVDYYNGPRYYDRFLKEFEALIIAIFDEGDTRKE